MKKLVVISIALLLSAGSVVGQGSQKITWSDLASVEFEYKYNDEFEMEVPYAKFGEDVKRLDGKIVEIRGYCIPLDVRKTHDIVILSKVPMSQCFFCGGAGPESVIDVIPSEKMPQEELIMDRRMTFRGRLELNPDNFDNLNYILRDAEMVAEKD